MKRFAWLLLAMSLPAWATINGVNSTRILLPSFDGSRYSQYPDGDKPQNPAELLYFNGFDGNPTNTIDAAYGNIGTIANQSDITFYPDSIGPGGDSGHVDGPDMFIVNDPAGGTNKVLKIFMDASSAGRNWESSSSIRHRALVRVCSNCRNDLFGPGENHANSHKTDGDGLRLAADAEYWFGFRVRTHVVGSMGSSGNKAFLFSPLSEPLGEPCVYVKFNGDWSVAGERYRKAGESPTEVKVDVPDVGHDAWHKVVIRWIRVPWSKGGATGYKPTVSDGTDRAGIFEIWIDGVKQDGTGGSAAASRTAANPGYTGTDHEATGDQNPRVRLGIYWVAPEWADSNYTVWLDDIMVMEGEDLYDEVSPP